MVVFENSFELNELLFLIKVLFILMKSMYSPIAPSSFSSKSSNLLYISFICNAALFIVQLTLLFMYFYLLIMSLKNIRNKSSILKSITIKYRTRGHLNGLGHHRLLLNADLAEDRG